MIYIYDIYIYDIYIYTYYIYMYIHTHTYRGGERERELATYTLGPTHLKKSS